MLEGASSYKRTDRDELQSHRFSGFRLKFSTKRPLAQRNLERNPVISVEPSWRILAIGYQPYVIQPGSVFLQTPKPIF